MQQLLVTLAQAIVDDPDRVDVRVIEEEQAKILQLTVAPDDMGKVIGKRGRIASAMRTIVRAAAIREGKHVIVEIID